MVAEVVERVEVLLGQIVEDGRRGAWISREGKKKKGANVNTLQTALIVGNEWDLSVIWGEAENSATNTGLRESSRAPEDAKGRRTLDVLVGEMLAGLRGLCACEVKSASKEDLEIMSVCGRSLVS